MAALCLQLAIPEVWVLNGSFAPRCFPLHNLKLNFASAPTTNANTHTNANSGTNNNANANASTSTVGNTMGTLQGVPPSDGNPATAGGVGGGAAAAAAASSAATARAALALAANGRGQSDRPTGVGGGGGGVSVEGVDHGLLRKQAEVCGCLHVLVCFVCVVVFLWKGRYRG